MFLKISQNSQQNACARVSFLINLIFIKKDTLAEVFSCEFCEIFKNTFFYRKPPVAASATPMKMFSCEFGEVFQNDIFEKYFRMTIWGDCSCMWLHFKDRAGFMNLFTRESLKSTKRILLQLTSAYFFKDVQILFVHILTW